MLASKNVLLSSCKIFCIVVEVVIKSRATRAMIAPVTLRRRDGNAMGIPSKSPWEVTLPWQTILPGWCRRKKACGSS